MAIGVDPKVDYAFKYLFGREESSPLLADLLSAVLGLSAAERIVDLELLNPFQWKETESDKLSILDVKARDRIGRQYNVEMQMASPTAFVNRLVYYWGKFYTQQLHEGEDYTCLQRTISICFLDGVLFPDVADHHLCFQIRERAHGFLFTDQFEAHMMELPKFRRAATELTQPLDRWLYFLRFAEQLEPGSLPDSLNTAEIQIAMTQLRQLTQEDFAREAYESRLKEKRDIATMLHVAEEAALARGREEGRQLGIEEGLRRGELIGRIRESQRRLGLAISSREELLPLALEELQRRSAVLEGDASP